MSDMKERILQVALGRFAREGYEAVSMRDIAGELGITKGALYRHYASKREIFDSILERMERRDAEQAARFSLPEAPPEKAAEGYTAATPAQVAAYGMAMFRYWTQDAFAAQFRRMLTLEQYRSPEMGRLYQQYLAAGPVGYLADLFSGMGVSRSMAAAVAFYGPMYLLYSVYDAAEDPAGVLALLDERLQAVGRRIAKEVDP